MSETPKVEVTPPQNQSATLGELAAALAKAQAVIANAEKDRANPFFNSTYATLKAVWEACRKPLTDNGLAVVQQVGRSGQEVSVRTMLVHASGEWVASVTTLPVLPPQKRDGTEMRINAQSYGSAITYGRRYGLAAMVGVAPDDDDDGNAATGDDAPSAPIRPPPSRPTASGARVTGVKVPFGAEKGKDIAEIDDASLASLGKYLSKQVNDPTKAQYAESNGRLLDAVAEESAARAKK